MDSNQKLHNIRHSLAHILASAVLEMFPKAKLGVGPVIENGFFYDFQLPRPLTPEDIKVLEKRMRALVQSKLDFERIEKTSGEAKEFFKNENQPFKMELISDIEKFGTTKADEILNNDKTQTTVAKNENPEATNVSLYKTGKFIDLCRGGHVENTSQIRTDAFKLDKVSGAYWRGDQANPQMQRVYGIAFETKEQLEAYQKQVEEAIKRDHRKLGKELGLFVFSDLVGPGLPLYTFKGAIVRREIANFSNELQKEIGYQEVYTPNMNKAELFKVSGHYEKYKDDMFKVISNYSKEEYYLKPMNCPQHTQIYASDKRSYKDLPIRISDFANLYRDEKPGELSGLTRLRAFCQDDGHSFCREDQIKDEFEAVLKIVKKALNTYGMDYYIRLSLWDPGHPEKFLGEPAVWEKSQKILEDILKENNIEYVVGVGDAAIYGPKMDIITRDSLNREWQVSTIQLDFIMPQRFGLTYIDKDGQEKTPAMVHRAIIGSPERFMAILIEHYSGAFPAWLSPVQVSILPISQKQNAYARKVMKELISANDDLRVELDDRDESVGKKIREATMQKIPYQIILGEKEVKAKKIAVRTREGKDLGVMALKKFVEKIKTEIEKKK